MWLNLELVKKPPECLEYVIEVAHLVVRTHDDRFVSLMDEHVPTVELAVAVPQRPLPALFTGSSVSDGRGAGCSNFTLLTALPSSV